MSKWRRIIVKITNPFTAPANECPKVLFYDVLALYKYFPAVVVLALDHVPHLRK